MNYAIIGSGAIGAFYGARLARVGKEVHFLFHNDYEHVCQHGLQIDSIDGDFQLPKVNAYRSTADMPKCDVVIVALKTTQNHLLREMLAPLFHQGSCILVIQNGIGWEEQLAEWYPGVSVAGAIAFVCCNKVGAGHIEHVDFGRLVMGMHCGDNAVLQQIVDDFCATSIPVELTDSLCTARWKKLVWNIAFNGVSVILNAKTSELLNCPATRQMVREVMEEVVMGANACGANIPDSYIQEMMDYSDSMKPYYPSMYLDYSHHRPMEIEAIYDAPVRLAAANGVSLPRIALLAQQLHFIEGKGKR